jgi:putative photosynthetic complex assembly protein 2
MGWLFCPALFAAFAWWFSTGVIILLDNLPPRSFRWSMMGGSLVLLGALAGLAVTAADGSVAGAYAAFTCGLLVWGWQEMSFFMGFVTGPRRTACAPHCTGWQRFRCGVEACLYHELTIIGFALVVAALTWNAANPVGRWTFLAIWAMRQSAKLNLFLGVRNLNEEFVPAHLGYLCSFMRQRRMNALLPFSVAAGAGAAALLLREAAVPGVPAARAAGLGLLVTMLVLGVLEHGLMVLPLPFARLWHWAVDRRSRAAGTTAAAAGSAPNAGNTATA